MEKTDDALWVGVDFSAGTLPVINVFRKRDGMFKLVKIIEGDAATKLYLDLTYTGDEANASKGNL